MPLPPAAPISVAIIVPCYNEAGTIRTLVERIDTALSQRSFDWQIIAIDDGSRDNTAEILRSLAAEYDRVRAIIFSRNFGKESAMLAGLAYSNSDYTVIMDGDLQHPPELVPSMLDELVKGEADQVIAKRNRQGDSWHRSALSRMYYRLVNRLVEGVAMDDGAGDFRALSRRVVTTLLALRERSRFSKGLFSWVGFPTAVIEYTNEQRASGQSSWSLRSLFNYGLDGIVSFNTKPLRVVAHFGGIVTLLALAYLIYLLAGWLLHGVTAPGYITTIATVVALSGVQLLALGTVGEYVGRIYQEVKRRPHYVVMEEHGIEQ